MCLSRRHFLGTGLGGFLAYATRNGASDLLFGQDVSRAKACIVLWMEGGPSQIDTFDPKTGPTGGEFKSIETAAKGVRIGEHLPRIAAQMKRLSIIRSLTSNEGEHQRATYLWHTGHPQIEGLMHPAAGAVVSRESSTDAVTIPRYVSIGSSGQGAAFLGAEHGPFVLEDPDRALETLRQLESRRDRFKLLEDLGREFDRKHDSSLVTQREAIIDRTAALLDTPFAQAIDLSKEPADLRDRYGRNAFGQGCLAARRLIESGVRFAEVRLGGWDTHQNNFNAVRGVCGTLDPAFSTLVDDLSKRGMLDSTIVLWLGEFGRTPNINADNGRDHFPGAFSAVIGGGGLAGGRVIGETDKAGASIARDPVKVADLFATVFDRFGFEHTKKYRDAAGGIVKMTEGGMPVRGLIS